MKIRKMHSNSPGEAPDRDTANDRGGVQSIERAFLILEEIARNGKGISLAELSKKVNLHNSTAFHLVRTLAALGYVRQVNKHYCVGSSLFALAAGARDEIDLANIGGDVLDELSSETGECAHLAVLSGKDVVTLARAAGIGALQVADQVGIVRPAHATALGKVLLSGLSPGELVRFLQDIDMKRYTPKTLTDTAALMREVEEVRQSGIAYDDREFDLEMRCVAARVLDGAGKTIAAVGISGPIWRISVPSLRERAGQVSGAAKRISQMLISATTRTPG